MKHTKEKHIGAGLAVASVLCWILILWIAVSVVEVDIVGHAEGGTLSKLNAFKAFEPEQLSEPQKEPVVAFEQSVDEITAEELEMFYKPSESETEVCELVSLGEYKITAYCSCHKCCGKWAENRPVDESGKEIVYTASGEVAEAGKTIAADTDILPFGTVVVINGNEYVVQDTGSAVKGRVIDIYFDSHEKALDWGCQYIEIFVKG